MYRHYFFTHSKFKRFLYHTWDFLTSKTGAFIIGVSAILIGSYQFYINRPILEYKAITTSLVSSQNDQDINLKINDKNFSDLYVTKVLLTNTGALALAGADVSKIGHDPIRVKVPKNAKVAHYIIDKNMTSQAVTADLEPVNGDIIIKFDFLNPDNAVGVTILHENADEEFVVTGSAVNVNSIKKAW